MKKIVLALGVVLGASSISFAEPNLTHLKEILGNNLKIEKVVPTEIDNVQEIYIEGVNIPLYITADGRYLIEGSITDLVKKVNLSEERQNTVRKTELAKIPESEMIVYEPKDAKYEVTIFTDVSCPYCKKLHDEIPEYLKEGIKVRYLAFPAISKAEKMESVWCAKDPKKAIVDALNKKNVDTVKCGENNPVEKQYALGISFGVTGTPNIILENGQMLGGYVPAKELIPLIKANKKN